MAVEVKVNSRLQLAELVKTNDIEYFEHVVAPEFPEQDDDIVVYIEDGMRLDLLAYEYYGDSDLMWVILQANEIFCYPFGLYIGKKIRLPNRDKVVGKILRAGE